MRVIAILVLIISPCLVWGQEFARVIDQETTYTIFDEESAEIEERVKIEILSEKGNRFSVFAEYFDRFRKITHITIDVVDKNGNKIKRLNRYDGQELGLSQSYEISDAKLLYINPNVKDYPYTLEINSKVKMNGFLSMPTWVPRGDFHLSVVHAKLNIVRPASFFLKIKNENLNPTKDIQLSDGKFLTQYEVSDLKHTDKKIRYQDFYDDQPKVLISPLKFSLDNVAGSNVTWAEFGNWFLSLNSDPYILTKETMAFLDSLDKADKKKFIGNVYQYMQDKTRYVSIQLGIGGFKSLPTKDVEKFGYGDCKALTTYMKNMLDYAGVKSNYILVRAGRDVPDVLAEFTSNQFNHVFLGIPSGKDTTYLECTSQTSPTDYTGMFTDDRNVLWIEKDKSSIIRSRVYSHIDNVQTNEAKIKLDSTGNALINLSISNNGVFFDEIMLYKMAPSDYVREHNQSSFNYDDFAIKDFSFNQPKRDVASFNSKFKLQVNGLAKLVNERLVFPISPLKSINEYLDKDDLMKYYSIKRGVTVTDEVEVILPRNYWIFNLPDPIVVNSSFGNYRLSMEVAGNTLKIKRSFIIYRGDYNRDNYEPAKVFFQSLEKIEKRKLVLNSKT